MKTFLLFVTMALQSLYTFGQAKVTFASPSDYKLKVVIDKQTQQGDQYVRFETMNAGEYVAQITVTTAGETYNLRSNISLPANRETSYFIIVVNKTAQIHWANEAELNTAPVASSQGLFQEKSPYNKGQNYSDRSDDYDYRQPDRNGYNQPRQSPYNQTIPCDCANPYPVLSREDATRLKVTVQHRAFDGDRLGIIQTALSRSNVMSADVMDLMRLLSFDNNRLKLAKYAYARTCDKQNYYRVSSVFDFSSNSRELQRFLQYAQ